jgi:putative membrane protein
MNILINLIIKTLAVLIAGYLLPGVIINSYLTALVAAVVLGLLNTFIKPILVILTLPINIFSLGLFTLVINALLIMLAGSLIDGFAIDSFVTALIFGVLLSLVNWFLSTLVD